MRRISQFELELNDWRRMSSAPKDSWWIEARNAQSVRIVHYACDLSGEEQPPFIGWFYEVKAQSQYSHDYFQQMCPDPTHWRPLYEHKAGGTHA